MSTRSPKERLHKLFHRHDNNTSDKNASSPPPAQSNAQGSQRRARKSSSRGSLRDAFNPRGRADSKPEQRGSLDVQDGQRRSELSPNTQSSAIPASSKAAHPNYSNRLPAVPRETPFSTDLQHLTHSEQAGKEYHSEDVAQRNMQRDLPDRSTARKPVSDGVNGAYDARAHGGETMLGGLPKLPTPSNLTKGAFIDAPSDEALSPNTGNKRHSLSRKRDISDFRGDAARAVSPTNGAHGLRRSTEARRLSVNGAGVDKALPRSPSDQYTNEIANDQPISRQAGATANPELAEKLRGILDLRNTEDTTLHERWAPAVTHETVRREVHEIREEIYTREYHNHHILHRVLPIIDIEVLPARHFVPVKGGYAEIAEEEVPGNAGKDAQWMIAETVSKMLPEKRGPVMPSAFTARKFAGTDGDYKEYTTPEGIKRTETWWVHPPTWEKDGERSGQTYPFYIGCPDPKDNGLRAHLPKGEVIGVSPLLAKQQKERMRLQQEQSGLPAVPPHAL